MSRFFKAQSGVLTMVVDDTTGSAPDLGEVRASGIRPSWGSLRRTARPGIYPCKMSVTLEDPGQKIKSRLTGSFTETDYDITLTGPAGPTGNDFKMKLLPKSEPGYDHISERIHPDETVITVYDGLSRMKDDRDYSADIYHLLDGGFNKANSSLQWWARIPARHTTDGWSGFHTYADIQSIVFPERSFNEWSNSWDGIEELCERYRLLVFQDPYHHGPNGDPRWKVVPRLDMGQSIGGLATTDTDRSAEAQPQDTVTVRVEDIADQGGNEYEDAIAFQVDRQLPESARDSEPDPLVVNGNNILRDGRFTFENSNDNGPFYGESQNATVSSTDGRIDLDADESNSNPAYWRSEPFNVGDLHFDGIFTYTLELTSGSNAGVEVFVQILDENENVVTSWSETNANATGIGKTIDFGNIGGRIRVGVNVPPDDNAAPTYSFGDLECRLYADQTFLGSGDESDIDKVPYSSEASGFLSRSVADFPDMILQSVPRVGTSLDTAPTSVYRLIVNTDGQGNFDFYNVYEAGEIVKEWEFRAHDFNAQTLRTKVRGHLLGPNTRVKVEDESGTVQREAVMAGGRKTYPLPVYTDIADLDVS